MSSIIVQDIVASELFCPILDKERGRKKKILGQLFVNLLAYSLKIVFNFYARFA